jgi:hypothetical protein
MNEAPKGPYTLWVDYGYEGWKFTDFPTLKEALEHDRYTHCDGWVITKPVQYDVTDVTPEDGA